MYGQILSTMGPIGTVLKTLVPTRIKAAVREHAAMSRSRLNRRLARQPHQTPPPSHKHPDSPHHSDFVTHMLPHLGRPDGLSPNEVLANAQILIIAGSETTATLLTATAYFLMTNPGPYERLKEEIRSVFASLDEITVTATGVSKLQYLDAVICEALRMHPPIPTGIHRLAPSPGGVVIDGRWVPGGTDVTAHQWVAYRSESYFGEEAHRFIPERWLGVVDVQEEEKKEDDTINGSSSSNNMGNHYHNIDDINRNGVFNPFSLGPRACMGRGLALAEARLVLARLVWVFDMELVDESVDWMDQKTGWCMRSRR